MPAPPEHDALLKFTHVVLTLLMGLLIIVGLIVALCIPLLLMGSDTLNQRLTESSIGPDQKPWIALIMALLVGGIAVAFLFLRELRRIVGTVSDGDPFVPINAARLKLMAWLVLGMQGLAILASPLVTWFDAYPHKANVHHGENGLSISALVLALLLFVLARVFRRGTEMRDELEGTI